MDQQLLAQQLRKPDGEPGKQVGLMMNKGNELINRWTINALELQPGDTVLEIGMGNGYFAKDVLNVHSSIKYTGIDYSDLMVEEAKAINQHFIAEQRADFQLGTADALPYPSGSFSKIFTINTIYFWDNAAKELAEIKRVLKSDGLFVIAIRSEETMQQMPFTEYGFIKYSKEALEATLANNGLTIIDCFQKDEPSYTFNDTVITMSNIIATCRGMH